MFPIAGLSLGIKAAIIGGVLLAVGAMGWMIYSKIEQGGYDRAVEEIAAKDKGAIDAVHKATGKVEACAALGGTWDSTVGLCR